MKRKFFAAFLSLCMVMSLVPITALAAEENRSNSDVAENTATITDADSLKTAISEANDGDTIEIPAGDYDIGSLNITKVVSLKGATEGKTTLTGSISYQLTTNVSEQNSENATITWENITLNASDTNSHLGLCLKDGEGYTLEIKNCIFNGWEYAIGVNSLATGNTLTMSNTIFQDTWCAMSVKMGNTVGTMTNVTVPDDGYAVQVFGTQGKETFDGYYETVAEYQEDASDDTLTSPSIGGIMPDGVYVANPQNLTTQLGKANDGDTVYLAAGTYALNNPLEITKRVSLEGAGAEKTIIVGPVSYKFSTNQNNNLLTVDGISFQANEKLSSVQGLQFKGDKPNNGYDVSITVLNCAFDGWDMGITMNSHANGYKLTVKGCDFSDSFYAVSYNYDNATEGQKANNSVSFSGNNIIAENGFAVQKFNNISIGNGMIDNSYATVEDFEKDNPTISGRVSYVTTSNELTDAITKASDGTTIIVAPGTYNGNITFGGKSLTIQAQYPAYKDGVRETDTSKLSQFTGTFNTYGTNSSSFNEDQKVVIEGFALSGDGLKIGNQNYNSVGNLEVRHCTMEFGQNSTPSNTNHHAGLNYFVKTSGSNDGNYASVTVEDNYISGTPDENIFPIQLWDVDKATVQNNVMDLSNAEDKQAISISKMDDAATVTITDNTISGAGGGIYVTTWYLDGVTNNNDKTFTGSITVKDNTMDCAESEMHPIFLGWANEGSDGQLGGTIEVSGNTDNGSPVFAVIGQPATGSTLVTATFMDGNTVVDYQYGTNSVAVDFPTLSDRGYNHFVGWTDQAGKHYDGGETVIITANTTFTAVWSYTPPANPNYKITIDDAANGTVTANPTAAKAGATVTLTPVPDEGYALSTLTVTDRFGNAVRVTEQADGTYTFTMPNGQVTVTATFVQVEEPAPTEPFVDVAEGDWFYDAVVYAYQNELMDGVGGNRFAPNSETTRAQLVTILYRLEGEPAVSGDLPFTDVESGTWYTDAILWAAQNNIVNGVNDTEFAPGDDLTRQQLVTILYRYAEAKGYDVSASADLSGYPDAGQVQDYAQPAMAWAVAENIIQGMEDGTLKPAGNASRAQIATILMRFCEDVAQ